jgi:hypothetical protein
MLRRKYIAGVAIVLAVILPTPALAWLRAYYEDAIVVERSEAIVVARLKRDSIKYVPHQRKPHEGRSWEHHAILIVSEVLKGKLEEREIPIVIHYGLTPVVGGHVKRDGFMMNYRRFRKDYPKDVIEIFDTGSSAMSFSPCLTDAGKDNLWFLRKRSGFFGREPGTGNFGIVDPQDVQPLSLKDYFLSYLAKDPEKAVTDYVAKHPDRAKRAERYLDHLEIERILKIADQKIRVERLLPYLAKHHSYGFRPEAEMGILACRGTAGPILERAFRETDQESLRVDIIRTWGKLRYQPCADALLAIFGDPAHRGLRSDIIQTWGKLKYRGCVDVLTSLLKQHDDFWSGQELENGWWNADLGSELTQERRDTYGEVYNAVIALREIDDPRAREVIELTKRRWKAINFLNPQIVVACERALETLAAAQKPTVHGQH